MSGKKLIWKSVKGLLLIAFCIVVVDFTQTAAMVILAGLHELGHAIVGLLFGEQLASVPSVIINVPIPMGIGGLTSFTDKNKGTVARVIAGPTVSLTIGLLLTLLFIPRFNIMSKFGNWIAHKYAGYVLEALTLLLFWSGFSIAKEFYNHSSGSDLGNVILTLAGQLFFFPVALFGLLIMSSLIVQRFIWLPIKAGMINNKQIGLYKKPMIIIYIIFLLIDIISLLILPVEAIVAAFGLLFMVLTVIDYFILIMVNGINLDIP